MTIIPDNPVYSKNTLEFITVCNDFCITMSYPAKIDFVSLTDYLVKVLPLLYLKAALLPEVEVSNPDMNERFVTQEEWEKLFLELRKLMGGNDEFWYIDQNSENADPIKGSISEHLADIFQDLQDFLLLYQKNSIDAKENALNEVARSFRLYWGYRLVNVQNILHHFSVKDHHDPTGEPFSGI
jgi:hypothetical protein